MDLSLNKTIKPGSKMFDGEYLIVDLDKPSSNKVENNESIESETEDEDANEESHHEDQSEEEMAD